MIFTADTKELATAIAMAGRVIPQKSPWPILTNLKIATNDNRITLIGSDGDTTFEMDVAACVDTEGAACVPFAPLSKFCAAAKSETIKVTVSEKETKASAGRSRISLGVQNLDEYPNFKTPEGDPVAMDKDTFCHALRFCLSAVEDSEVKFHIAGPNFSEGKGFVDVWGIDGNTAHHARIADLKGIGGGGTLPYSAASTVLSMADKSDNVRFMVSAHGWHLVVKDARAWGKVVDKAYPDMDKVVSQFEGWANVAIVTRDDLSTALDIAACGTAEDSKKFRNIVIQTDAGKPIVVRGLRGTLGVLQAGRAEIETPGSSPFLGVVNGKYINGAVLGMKADDFLIEGTMNGGEVAAAVRVKPAQSSATLDLMAFMMGQRFSAKELAE